MQILVTNDDGIDSKGLLVLAEAMTQFGTVTIVAPDSEYSGAGASLGPLHLLETVVTETDVGIEGVEAAWTVNGPPALCVYYARLGTFGFMPDLIVSGINPGANLGRAVYHSGTIGAVLTGRSRQIPGIAVSQSFADPLDDSPEARADYDERVSRQLWQSAADVAVEVVAAMLTSEFEDSPVINLNVPNLPIDELNGWRWTEVSRIPPWTMTEAKLVPHAADKPGVFTIESNWGEATVPPAGTDSAAILDHQVSITLLSHIEAVTPNVPAIDAKLDAITGG